MITKRGEDRWLIQSLYEDGKPQWNMATEIVCLAGGRLYVGGDSFPVLFAHCSDPGIARVRWLGAHNDITYYVAQKAHIGFGGGELVQEYDPDVARADLDALADEFIEYMAGEDEGCPPDHPMLVSIREAHAQVDDGREQVVRFLRDAAEQHECYSFIEERYEFGIIVASRVYYAWGAMRRLVELIDQEEERERGGQQQEAVAGAAGA